MRSYNEIQAEIEETAHELGKCEDALIEAMHTKDNRQIRLDACYSKMNALRLELGDAASAITLEARKELERHAND